MALFHAIAGTYLKQCSSKVLTSNDNQMQAVVCSTDLEIEL